jgi:hypothetical protein
MAGAAAAYASPSASHSRSAMHSAWSLVAVNAHLERSLSASNARPGQKIMAKLDHPVTIASGMKLDRGTVLLGRVDGVHRSKKNGPSSVSIVFTEAKMHNGHLIPVKVTVLGAYPFSQADMGLSGSNGPGPAPSHVSPKTKVDQEAGLLADISMHSAVQSRNSAIFRRDKGNLRLRAGTYLQVAIAARHSHHVNRAA